MWAKAIKVWANVIKVWANAIKVWANTQVLANAIKFQDKPKKIHKRIVLGNWLFKIIEIKYESFNALSKHFVGCKNPFFFSICVDLAF